MLRLLRILRDPRNRSKRRKSPLSSSCHSIGAVLGKGKLSLVSEGCDAMSFLIFFCTFCGSKKELPRLATFHECKNSLYQQQCAIFHLFHTKFRTSGVSLAGMAAFLVFFCCRLLFNGHHCTFQRPLIDSLHL